MAIEDKLRRPDSWYRGQAIAYYQEEGELEIDEDSPVSRSDENLDGGAYVQAWLWISDQSAEGERNSVTRSVWRQGR